jgi:hypothetical protein
VLKTCLGCGAKYAFTLAQCPQDGSTSYLESGQAVLAIDAPSTATTGTLVVGHAAQVDTTSADCARTLPSASSAGAAGVVQARKVDGSTHTLTLNRTGSDTITDGATTGLTSYVASGAGATVELRSNGTATWTVTRLVTIDPAQIGLFLTRSEGVALAGAGASLAVVLDT